MTGGRGLDTLTTISMIMLLWVTGVIGSYIIINFVIPIFLGNLYEPNGQIFAYNFWLMVIGSILFLLTIGIVIKQVLSPRFTGGALGLTVLVSVAILALVVFLTGGFLDSPYSGAISLYISFFILMVRKGEYPKYNIFLIIVTILLLTWPYFYLYWRNYESVHIIQWKNTVPITFSRLIANIILTVVTVQVGANVSERVATVHLTR